MGVKGGDARPGRSPATRMHVESDETSSQPDDPEALLARAQGGDREALDRLLRPHWDAVYRLAYRVTGHVQDAEDLAGDAFVRILRYLPAYRGDCSFRTWVRRIALNVCLTARRRRRESPIDPDRVLLADPASGPEDATMAHLLQEQTRKEILRLPQGCREAVLLRLIEELPYEEIAEILGISVGVARLKVSRGMSRLRARLRPWLEEDANS
jgi:RNA polymerase sigma-70 factor (ECF subfamily)